MRRKNSSGKKTVYASIRTGMAVFGAVLLFFLVGKAVVAVPWQSVGAVGAGNVKEVLAKVTGVLWKNSYPSLALEEHDTASSRKDTPWYLEWLWNRIPVYRYYTASSRTSEEGKESDPSYIKYLEKQSIYKEHEYLFRDGDEESGETQSPAQEELAEGTQPETQPGTEGETTSVETSTLALTPSPSHQIVGKQYVLEQLADYDFLMKNFYNVHPSTTAGRELMDAKTFLAQDFTLNTGSDQPQILIYHTHSQETYADYGPEHQDGTVIGIGNYLTELLQAKGYHVIHDTSVYDLHDGKLDRNKAYTYALEGITAILQKYPSIEVILDVHRDGVGENVRLVSEVNGKRTASIMLFNGTSQTPTGPIEYLQNPYRTENLAFSLQMKLNAEAYYPGLTRKIYLKGLRYNLHLRPRSALLEVGAQTNTTEEAMNAMEPLAELLDILLQGK